MFIYPAALPISRKEIARGEEAEESMMGMMMRRDMEAELNLPPGFRFHPTDEELVVHYLCRKVAKQCIPVPIIAEVDLYKHDPWDLPEKALFGQREWYFFTPRDRKYPNGSRPNRAAGRGYWKATGADKPVAPRGHSRPIGIKKALVFYNGKAPKGVKTDWIMHEYRLADTSRTVSNKMGSLRLDDWVLCRLYNKKNAWEQQQQQQRKVKVQQEEENSDSFQTVESDVELPDLDDHVQPAPLNLAQASHGTQANQHQPLKAIKEDNDWFHDLNLDDLQGPFTAAAFQSQSAVPGVGMDVGSSQDYFFSGLGSPFPRPGQTNIPPF